MEDHICLFVCLSDQWVTYALFIFIFSVNHLFKSYTILTVVITAGNIIFDHVCLSIPCLTLHLNCSEKDVVDIFGTLSYFYLNSVNFRWCKHPSSGDHHPGDLRTFPPRPAVAEQSNSSHKGPGCSSSSSNAN